MGALRSEARKSGAPGCGGFPCRSAGRERREVPKSSYTVPKPGIYVKAEVKGILLNGAEFLSKASKSRLAWFQIKSRRKHITPPE